MVKRLSILLVVVGFVSFLGVPEIFACQCADKPTIVEEMEDSRVVVTGRIESVKKVREEEREHDLGAYWYATLLVDKVFSGNVKAGDKLLLAQGGGADCAFTWDDKDVGNKFLFYLGQPSAGNWDYILQGSTELSESEKVPLYRTSFCGRSTNLAGAGPDLAYWNNLAKRKGKTRVSGVLDFGERPVEGIEVRIKGKNSQFKTKYVKGGFFEIYDIPPGEYVLEIFPPFGWTAVENWRSYSRQPLDPESLAKLKKNQRFVRLGAGGHVDVDLALAPDTMIKGRILSPTNKPIANVLVSAVPVGGGETARGRMETDGNGEFRFETLEPGNYILIANPDGKIDDERPFGRLYYPGVTVKENAGLVAVEPGNYAVGLDIHIPLTTRLIEVTGYVLFADDKPAKDIWIRFEPTDGTRFEKMSVRSGEDGRFSLMIPTGASGVVTGARYFSDQSYSKCPEILATIKASDSPELKTTTLEITGVEPISAAILRFPFNFCEEN